ncbi:hypothetical protein V2J09_014617 [Rumex salicifolius]
MAVIAAKIEGSGNLHPDSRLFQQLLDQNGLVDLHFTGAPFTRSRGSGVDFYVAKRLDRAIATMNACLNWPDLIVKHLPTFSSDHTPFLICLKNPTHSNRRRRPFQFEAAWLSHPNFHNFLHSVWPVDRPPMTALSVLRRKLITWNKSIFGDISVRKEKLLQCLETIQIDLNNNPTTALFELDL